MRDIARAQKLVRARRATEIDLAVIKRHAADRATADPAQVARRRLGRAVFGRRNTLGIGRRRRGQIVGLDDGVAVFNAGRIDGVAVDNDATDAVAAGRAALDGKFRRTRRGKAHQIGIPATGDRCRGAGHARFGAAADIDGAVAAKGNRCRLIRRGRPAALGPLLNARGVKNRYEAVGGRRRRAIDADIGGRGRTGRVHARAVGRRLGRRYV